MRVCGDGNNAFISAFFSVGGTGVTLFFVLSGFLLFSLCSYREAGNAFE